MNSNFNHYFETMATTGRTESTAVYLLEFAGSLQPTGL